MNKGTITNYQCYSTDVAGQLAFGQPLNTQTESTNRIFPRSMVSLNGLVNIFSKTLY